MRRLRIRVLNDDLFATAEVRVKPKENLKTKKSGLGLGTALSLSKLVACDIVAALHSASE